MNLHTIGKNIKKYRLAQKLRQEDLAERVNLSPNYIGMLERGEKIPALETFLNIASVLSVSADQLLADTGYNGYKVKDSLLAEKLEKLSPADRQQTYDVIDAMLKHKYNEKS